MLMRVYAKCMTGLEDVWIGRMTSALHLEDPPPDDDDAQGAAEEDGASQEEEDPE
jgi:hypothetical protein